MNEFMRCAYRANGGFRSLEATVAVGAAGETLRTRGGLTAQHDFQVTPKLVAQGIGQRQARLLVCGETIGTHIQLREGGDLFGGRFRGAAALTVFDDTRVRGKSRND